MPWPPAPVAIGDLCQRLIHSLKVGVSSGSLTVRRLAREVGVSQPHMQNIMNGKRSLTIQMADRLLLYQRRSALELATATELEETLRRATTNSRSVQYVPVLPGRLGPSNPFPELTGETGWRPLPRRAIAQVAHPVFAELGPDIQLTQEFPEATFALLDLSGQARANISQDLWYAIEWSGGGWIRRLRRESRELVVLGQQDLRPMLAPSRIALGTDAIEEHVRGLVVWLGRDPRDLNPLESSGYLVPPPAEDS